ncbi:MAG TPA: zinc ribbon domain-containing protein [Symbiobacteriaceae bacterium]|nr:zinc ribbon domain-containing protein [Symbiobacteriaceae bacterium]
MMQCSHCGAAPAPGAKHCPNCGQPVAAGGAPGQAPPPPPGSEKARQFQDQAAAAAQVAWVRIRAAGPAKVGLGLMVLSAVVGLIFKGQRSIWASGWPEIILALAVMAYVGYREFTGQDPLARFWYAPLVAVGYLALWGVSEFRFRLGSLIFLAGALLLAWTYIWPLRDYAKSVGLDWRYTLYGYRRPVALGSLIGLLSLILTWIPDRSTSGWWSGGYSYSSYYGGPTWDYLHTYNPGLYLPSFQGYSLTGSVLLMAGLLACLFFAAFAPQFAMPKWYRHLPFIVLGYSLLFFLYTGSISWGQPIFLIGAGLIGWGAYQLSVKGVAEGKGDLREIPLQQWLGRWM